MITIVYMISGKEAEAGDVALGLCPDIFIDHGLCGSLVGIFGVDGLKVPCETDGGTTPWQDLCAFMPLWLFAHE